MFAVNGARPSGFPPRGQFPFRRRAAAAAAAVRAGRRRGHAARDDAATRDTRHVTTRARVRVQCRAFQVPDAAPLTARCPGFPQPAVSVRPFVCHCCILIYHRVDIERVRRRSGTNQLTCSGLFHFTIFPSIRNRIGFRNRYRLSFGNQEVVASPWHRAALRTG